MFKHILITTMILCLGLHLGAQDKVPKAPTIEKGSTFMSLRNVEFDRFQYIRSGGGDGTRVFWGAELGFGYSFADNWVVWAGFNYQASRVNPEDPRQPDVTWSNPNVYVRRYLTNWQVLKRSLSPYANLGVTASFYRAEPDLLSSFYIPNSSTYSTELTFGLNWRVFPRWSVEADVGASYIFASINEPMPVGGARWGAPGNLGINFHL